MKRLYKTLIAIGIVSVPLALTVAGRENPVDKPAVEARTAFVVIDDASTAEIGPMPVDRSHIADAITALRDAGAKAVAIKFFYDTDKPSDTRLVEAMKRFPVLLQYSLDPSGTAPTPAGREDLRSSHNEILAGRAAMIPTRALREHMAGMGFVNEHNDEKADGVVVIGRSPDGPAASLQLEILEQILGGRAKVHGDELLVHERHYKLDAKGRVSCNFLDTGRPKRIPIMDVLRHKVDPVDVKDKVVVIGYVRKDTPVMKVSLFQTLPVHEYFYRQSLCLANLSQ